MRAAAVLAAAVLMGVASGFTHPGPGSLLAARPLAGVACSAARSTARSARRCGAIVSLRAQENEGSRNKGQVPRPPGIVPLSYLSPAPSYSLVQSLNLREALVGRPQKLWHACGCGWQEQVSDAMRKKLAAESEAPLRLPLMYVSAILFGKVSLPDSSKDPYTCFPCCLNSTGQHPHTFYFLKLTTDTLLHLRMISRSA
jgi:hypothetical protein